MHASQGLSCALVLGLLLACLGPPPSGGSDGGADAGADAGATVDSGAPTDSGSKGVDAGGTSADAGRLVPVFVAEGMRETFGEITPHAKHAVSHRARAFEKLVAACLA